MGCNPFWVMENVQKSSLDREQVFILYLRTVEPHELRQAHEVFTIRARGAPADGDLGSDLLVRGGAEVDGVVRRGDVDQGQQRTLPLLLGKELHCLHHVTPRDNLPRVQVLEGPFNLGIRHLVGHSPGASLAGKEGRHCYTLKPKPQ